MCPPGPSDSEVQASHILEAADREERSDHDEGQSLHRQVFAPFSCQIQVGLGWAGAPGAHPDTARLATAFGASPPARSSACQSHRVMRLRAI